MVKDYALIIGINDYTPPEEMGLRKLHAAIRDAQEFEEWFVGGGGRGKVCHETVYSSSAPLRPVHEEIDRKFGLLLAEAEREPENNGRLYFYFAGHGMGLWTSASDNALCLANWSETRRNDALSSQKYHDLIVRYGLFRQVVVLLDCCRELKMVVTPRESVHQAMSARVYHNTEVFQGYATEYRQVAQEITGHNGEMRGAFTTALLRGLRGGAADQDGNIHSHSLKLYLDRHVPEVGVSPDGLIQVPEVHDGFKAQNSILCSVPPGWTVACKIRIKQHRIGPVSLVDHDGIRVLEMEDPAGREFVVQLTHGTYILVDRQNLDSKDFKIETSIANPTPRPKIIDF